MECKLSEGRGLLSVFSLRASESSRMPGPLYVSANILTEVLLCYCLNHSKMPWLIHTREYPLKEFFTSILELGSRLNFACREGCQGGME